MKVLVCEDDENILRGLVQLFEREGYSVIPARTGAEALRLFERESPQFVCLDIMLPDGSGYDLCKALRERDKETPIMVISARASESDRVLGLELGADDYVTKPFGTNEVLSRIRAITRRCLRTKRRMGEVETPPFPIGELLVHPDELRAERDGIQIELSLREIKILSLLVERRGKAVDRDTLFNVCWSMNYLPNSRTLDQHISKLRKKVGDDPKHPRIIETVHGVGYRYRG